MIKNIIKQNENLTVCDKELNILKENFPSCFDKDGNFDIEIFKNQINQKVNVSNEGFDLDFLGKTYAKLIASLETTTVIVPDKTHNAKDENKNSENIYISGDNIDALKHLIKSYSNQIKCIYIDPPYNTGSDGFCYKDKFTFTNEELQEKLSISYEEAERILNFTSKESASHSAWLTFMYPRLKIAKQLLKESGGIFISIDDNELYNLKYICDEIFGPENFVGIAPRKTKGSATTQGQNELQNITDYIMIYFNEKVGSKFNKNIVGKKKYPYSDEKGYYKTVSLQDNGPNGTQNARPNLYYPIYQLKDGSFSLEKEEDSKEFFPKEHHHTNGCWMWSKNKFEKDKEFLCVINNTVQIKHYYNPNEDQNELKHEKLWIEKIYNNKGTKAVNDLFPEKGLFSNPKPVELVDWCIKLLLNDKENNIVIDFFSGSGTTAEAVMEFNKKINSDNNKFILVQLPENLQENFDKSDPKGKVQIQRQMDFLKSVNRPLYLNEMGIERVIRAGKKYDNGFDNGFKHFILKQPTANTLDKLENFDPNALIADESILDEFGKECILATWLNNDGYGLSCQAQEIDLDGYTAYYKDNHIYLIDGGFENKNLKALFEKYSIDKTFNPENIVIFGYSFTLWSVMEAIEINIKQLEKINKNISIDVRY